MYFPKVYSFYFHPSIILVDDDICILETLGQALSINYDIHTCNKPEKFLELVLANEKDLQINEKTKELNENSSDKKSILNLNYTLVSEFLTKLFEENKFISFAFLDYFMPNVSGIDCARKIKDLKIFKVLLTSSLDNKDVIYAFNENIIQQYVPKSSDNLVDEIISIINKNHLSIIDSLNNYYYGDFYDFSPHQKIYNNSTFIKIYNEIIKEYDIKFTCVYEMGGSMIMKDHKGNNFLLNIYSEDELNNVLFESIEFDQYISDYNKKLCKNFEIIIDYKKNTTDYNLNSLLTNKLTDVFKNFKLDGLNYYCVFQKLVIE